MSSILILYHNTKIKILVLLKFENQIKIAYGIVKENKGILKELFKSA